jgi:hypothetical protein
VPDENVSAAATDAHEEGVPAPAAVEETPLLTSAPPTIVSLTENPPQLLNGPAPKKRKIATPAIVSDSISDKYASFFTQRFSDSTTRNLCRQDWLKSHEAGTEDDFKTYWLSLAEEEVKVCVVAVFENSHQHHRVASIPAVETGSCRAGTSSLYTTTCHNELTDTTPLSEKGS